MEWAGGKEEEEEEDEVDLLLTGRGCIVGTSSCSVHVCGLSRVLSILDRVFH